MITSQSAAEPLDLDALAREILPIHRHIDEDCWYCCGLCEIEGGCCDDSQRGKCNCNLEHRRGMVRAVLARAVEAEREEACKVVNLFKHVIGGATAGAICHEIRARGAKPGEGA
jgi:hypothetical protein